ARIRFGMGEAATAVAITDITRVARGSCLARPPLLVLRADFSLTTSPRPSAGAGCTRILWCAFGAIDMCRSIKTLFNFEPPATEEETRGAALQFVRKLSGFNAPSKVNQAAFDRAIEEVAEAARRLISSLVTSAEPRNRVAEARRAQARSAARFPPRS